MKHVDEQIIFLLFSVKVHFNKHDRNEYFKTFASFPVLSLQASIIIKS